MDGCFQTTRYQRRHGARVIDFTTHVDEAAQRLSDDGVSLDKEKHVSGWFFLQRLRGAASASSPPCRTVEEQHAQDAL